MYTWHLRMHRQHLVNEMYRAWCRFYGPLNDLLPIERQQHDIPWTWDTPEPVREMIEGLGVPHVEVGLILVNGDAVGWEHRLQDGDRVAVYPHFVTLDPASPISLRCTEEPLGSFVLDVHLGRLARWLRLLGIDAAYSNDCDDETLANISRDEHRILLTRDRRLLMRSAVEHGHWVRTPEPREQLSEVIRRYNLLPLFRPYTRCARCNGLLEPVSREEVAQLLQPRTAQLHTEFTRCQQCGQVYWPGSHLRRLREILNTVQEGLLDEEQHPKAKKREELG